MMFRHRVSYRHVKSVDNMLQLVNHPSLTLSLTHSLSRLSTDSDFNHEIPDRQFWCLEPVRARKLCLLCSNDESCSESRWQLDRLSIPTRHAVWGCSILPHDWCPWWCLWSSWSEVTGRRVWWYDQIGWGSPWRESSCRANEITYFPAGSAWASDSANEGTVRMVPSTHAGSQKELGQVTGIPSNRKVSLHFKATSWRSCRYQLNKRQEGSCLKGKDNGNAQEAVTLIQHLCSSFFRAQQLQHRKANRKSLSQ